MAITVTTGLDADTAAFAPMVIAGTTDRWPFTGSTRQSLAITTIGEGTGAYEGFVVMVIGASAGAFITGDTVLVDITGTGSEYNGRHNDAMGRRCSDHSRCD